MAAIGIHILEKLPVEIIQDFRRTRQSQAIAPNVQEYILQLDQAANILNGQKGVAPVTNIRRAAIGLQELYPNISYNTCRTRIEDAINYFNVNNAVKEDAWNNFYADRMEDIAQLAIAKDDLRQATSCFERARDYRLQASRSAISTADLKPKPFLVSPDVDAKRLGIPEFNLKKLWPETTKYVNKLPITSDQKERIKREAGEVLGIETIDNYESVE